MAKALGAASHRVISLDLRAIGGSALTDDIEVPKDQEPDSGEVPITYVPARNTVLLSLLLGFAEVIEQPVFNLFYPCGLPFQELDDYP